MGFLLLIGIVLAILWVLYPHCSCAYSLNPMAATRFIQKALNTQLQIIVLLSTPAGGGRDF
jgi:hypothetical protein